LTPDRHLAVSGLLALGCGMTWRSPEAAVVALAAGTALDLDHLLDYSWNRSGRFTPARFVRMCAQFRLDRLYLLAHSLEWIIPFLAWSWLAEGPAWLKAAGLGLGSHIFMDMAGNGMRPMTYFFLYRWRAGFDSRKLVGLLPPEAIAYWGSYEAYLERRRKKPVSRIASRGIKTIRNP